MGTLPPPLDGPDAATPRAFRFEPLYYGERLHQVNPFGDVGVMTLWSPIRTVLRKLGSISEELLDPERSRIAVIGNLYGDGMLAMLCNLLYNPQIRHLVAVGQDLGLSTCTELAAFLDLGLEDGMLLGTTVRRVPGTERVFPVLDGFDEQRLKANVSFSYLGKLSSATLAEDVMTHIVELPKKHGLFDDRARVELPEFGERTYVFQPSDVASHQVVRRSPLECWQELVVRAVRFGHRVSLAGGPRLELLNTKVVITEPAEEPASLLAQFGFDPERFRRYQDAILDPEPPEGISYTYGNRLRGYFAQSASSKDTLTTVIETLRHAPDSRRAYISLWDTSADTDADPDDGHVSLPCLTTLFFRRSEGRLSLTATFRAHNLLWAWLENVYGLMAIHDHVATGARMDTGPITVVSHSLGMNPQSPRYELALAIERAWKSDDDFDGVTEKYSLREDPHGYFVVSADHEQRRIVAEHRFAGVLIKRYEGDRAASIERQVAADMAVSLVSHAMWLGRQLATAEADLRSRRSVADAEAAGAAGK